MDQYEKAIREKVFGAKILSDGEWVYLVGLFGMARDHDDLVKENERMRSALQEIADEEDTFNYGHTLPKIAQKAIGRS